MRWGLRDLAEVNGNLMIIPWSITSASSISSNHGAYLRKWKIITKPNSNSQTKTTYHVQVQGYISIDSSISSKMRCWISTRWIVGSFKWRTQKNYLTTTTSWKCITTNTSKVSERMDMTRLHLNGTISMTMKYKISCQRVNL